jgi:hypothetical protein
VGFNTLASQAFFRSSPILILNQSVTTILSHLLSSRSSTQATEFLSFLAAVLRCVKMNLDRLNYEPVQKGPCIAFKHPSGHEMEKVNRANLTGVSRLDIGKKSTCPSGNSKEFCAGWQSATQQLTIRHNNTATIIPSYYKQVSVFCMPVRLPFLVWYNWCIW